MLFLPPVSYTALYIPLAVVRRCKYTWRFHRAVKLKIAASKNNHKLSSDTGLLNKKTRRNHSIFQPDFQHKRAWGVPPPPVSRPMTQIRKPRKAPAEESEDLSSIRRKRAQSQKNPGSCRDDIFSARIGPANTWRRHRESWGFFFFFFSKSNVLIFELLC